MNRRALLALAAACWLLLPSTVWSEEIVRRIYEEGLGGDARPIVPAGVGGVEG